MSVTGEQLEPAARQPLDQSALLLGRDTAAVAREQQYGDVDRGEQRQGIDRLEAIVQLGGDIGPAAVHLGDDPLAEFRTGMLGTEAVAEGPPAPFADAIGAYRFRGACAVERIDPR